MSFKLRSKKNCQHKGQKLTKLLKHIANCELTVVVCADCDQELSKPKLECE